MVRLCLSVNCFALCHPPSYFVSFLLLSTRNPVIVWQLMNNGVRSIHFVSSLLQKQLRAYALKANNMLIRWLCINRRYVCDENDDDMRKLMLKWASNHIEWKERKRRHIQLTEKLEVLVVYVILFKFDLLFVHASPKCHQVETVNVCMCVCSFTGHFQWLLGRTGDVRQRRRRRQRKASNSIIHFTIPSTTKFTTK